MHGPIRGLIGRWVMRMEASGQVMSLVFQGTTAVSALSGVLAYTGFQQYVPFVLAAGAGGILVFAFAYVELGLYNRKNKEREDRGRNFAKPQNWIDNEIIARTVVAGIRGRELSDEERDAICEELNDAFQKHRNGVKMLDD